MTNGVCVVQDFIYEMASSAERLYPQNIQRSAGTVSVHIHVACMYMYIYMYMYM